MTCPKDLSARADSSATDPSASIENRSDDRYSAQSVDRHNDEDDDEDDGDGDGDEVAPKKKCKFDARSSDETNEELYQRLMELDPERARSLHPNDRRKITRYDLNMFIDMSGSVYYRESCTEKKIFWK